MRIGKLTSQELQEEVLSKLSVRNKEILLSAALGEDCSALKTDKITLYSSDPITSCSDVNQIGSLVVDVCSNDISACGGVPIALLLTIILPTDFTKEDVGVIMESAQKRCDELGIDIIGGHTEFSDSVVRPIACGTAIGTAVSVVTKKSLKKGDSLIVTKTLGMESATLLVSDCADKLTCDELEEVVTMRNQLNVMKESAILAGLSCVSSMHDVTEGGVLGAVAEICEGACLGAELYEESMPVNAVTAKICAEMGVDVLRTLSSGSLLVSTTDPEKCIEYLSKAGIMATKIGIVTDGQVNVIKKDGTKIKVDILPDEVCRIGESK